ncbi:integrin beta A [Brachionus plicatilis]|uniref:Integrin beta A n=1 Tax=Brachionus plicatilis TaxID=10195 RepID=A0A3M7P600_BRAPC|nr:integrin beta A [Brachionus plicatilis]
MPYSYTKILNVKKIELERYTLKQTTYFIDSSHFYGGSISSKPIKDNVDNVTFNFTIGFSYRSSYSYETYCDSNTILNKTLIGPHYYIYCVSGCDHAYTAIASSEIYCLSYSKEIDWTFGSRTFSYTIPKVNTYQIEFYGSDWGNLVVFGYNRTGSSWELRHSLDSTNNTYSKAINSSPETLMSPVTSIPINSFHVIDIPYIDEDDDVVRCRWAEWLKKECRDVCMAVPFGYLDTVECKLYLNTSQAQLGFYAAAIQLEDFKGNNFSHPISSVPLQFLIHIVEETNCTLQYIYLSFVMIIAADH